MSGLPADEGGALDVSALKRKRGVSFLSVISLGNILGLAGMIGTGFLAIYTVGGMIQHYEDAQAHETEMRVAAEAAIAQQLSSNASQEARDIATLTAVLQDMRADFRALLQANTPQPEPHHR